MDFRIADTFQDSLAKLTGDEQKAVKTTAFDLQMDPTSSGMNFHKLAKSRDKNFWSVRVSRDIRLIVHKTETSMLLCYVGHHDPAYAWAERRKLEVHPTTGAAQIVEVRERVEEVVVPRYVEDAERPARSTLPLFAGVSEEDLLRYGVPEEWLADVKAATEDTLFDLTDHLPAEASEALLELATGSKPELPAALPGTDPFEHPDAQRRFRTLQGAEELERALDYPWEKWTVFLHPAQRSFVERDYNGPARVSGSAGTGKTVVALHRAVYLVRQDPDARVLLTTFPETLASALRVKLRRLIGNEPRLGERVEVHAIDAIGERLYQASFGRPEVASQEQIRHLVEGAPARDDLEKFSTQFLLTEWEQVVDAWQLSTWEAYRDVARLGRKTRLPEQQRARLWAVFETVRAGLAAQGLVTSAQMFTNLATRLSEGTRTPFDFVVVDEAQDLSVPQVRFLAALSGGRPNGLFLAGDIGQRIFQQAFSWKALGVDIRGRSRTLRINYRTSHQIRSHADRLLAPELSDVDENVEERRGTVSAFNGPQPQVERLDSPEEEAEVVASWLRDRVTDGVLPHEMGVFVRSEGQLDRAREAVAGAGLTHQLLNGRADPGAGKVAIGTMHLAKGLEFRAVAVMACDDEIIPLQERIETVVEDSDLQEVYDTERHLLYVACTRARDHLLVTSGDIPSEFLDDLAPAVNRSGGFWPRFLSSRAAQ